jgi:hypothetical protein
VHDLSHEVLHVDSKIFRTVWLLLRRPGLLTREYFAGRRARYVPPIRLYLVFSVIYFALAAVAPGGSDGFKITYTPTPGETPEQTAEEFRKLGVEDRETLVERIREAVNHQTPHAMFLLLPLFAALVGFTLRRTPHAFPHHLIFALHAHAGWFATASISTAAAWMPWHPAVVTIQVAMSVYRLWFLPMSFRTAYHTTVAGAIWRALVVGLLYLIAIIAALAVIVLFALNWRHLPGLESPA